MTYSLRIADLPLSERPRERLVAYGPKSLSTAELIAILLRTGQGHGKLSAVGLGQHILQQLSENQRDPLEQLRDLTVHELINIEGLGPAKATTILAAVELGKRVFYSRPPERQIIDDPDKAAAALTHDLMWQAQERFAVLLLDVKIASLAQKRLPLALLRKLWLILETFSGKFCAKELLVSLLPTIILQETSNRVLTIWN